MWLQTSDIFVNENKMKTKLLCFVNENEIKAKIFINWIISMKFKLKFYLPLQ